MTEYATLNYEELIAENKQLRQRLHILESDLIGYKGMIRNMNQKDSTKLVMAYDYLFVEVFDKDGESVGCIDSENEYPKHIVMLKNEVAKERGLIRKDSEIDYFRLFTDTLEEAIEKVYGIFDVDEWEVKEV